MLFEEADRRFQDQVVKAVAGPKPARRRWCLRWAGR